MQQGTSIHPDIPLQRGELGYTESRHEIPHNRISNITTSISEARVGLTEISRQKKNYPQKSSPQIFYSPLSNYHKLSPSPTLDKTEHKVIK